MPLDGWDRNRHVATSLLEVIGKRPLVCLRETSGFGPEVLGNIEWYGPSGSLKDRIYVRMIACAEADRRL